LLRRDFPGIGLEHEKGEGSTSRNSLDFVREISRKVSEKLQIQDSRQTHREILPRRRNLREHRLQLHRHEEDNNLRRLWRG